MQQVYKARYYDGKVSKPHTVFVNIEGQTIFIQTNDGVQRVWRKDDFREIDFSSAIVTLAYGNDYPYEQLEVTDPDFINVYRHQFRVGVAKRWLHFGSIGSTLVLVLGFIGSVILGYIFALPAIADQVAQQFPQSYEVSMGEGLMNSYLSNAKIDSAKTKNINAFFDQLVIETSYPIKIVVVKDSIVNAFAMPGGGIVVYDGILKRMDKPEQLAALLSHEFSHVQLKHATRNVFRSIAGALFISIVLSDANGIASLVVENAHQLNNLKYSRELEHEADENGLNILKQNDIDPTGMSDLFLLLKLQHPDDPDEILSTHPDLDSRIDFVIAFQQEYSFKSREHDSLNYYFNLIRH